MAARHPLAIDRAAARRFVERALARHAGHVDALAREIESRMAERLLLLRHTPKRILDAGCGARSATEVLRARYTEAEVIALDHAPAALSRVRRAAQPSLLARARRWLGGTHLQLVCADLAQLPLAPRTVQMVWANLALGAVHDPLPVFREWHRVLDAGGLVLFSTYGPDTLRELRAAFAVVDDVEHVHRFIDMHDLGDMLVASGFGEPIMDMEHLTLTYATTDQLFADLRASGQQSALLERGRGLYGRNRWRRMLDSYATSRREERWPATIEVVYGLAWKLIPKLDRDGNAVVQLDRLRAKSRSKR